MNLPERKRTRLKNYDYSLKGSYFITICTQDRKPLLSRIETVHEGAIPETILLPFGRIAEEHLKSLPNRYTGLTIDNYVIMPNHIHILMCLNKGGAEPSPNVSDIICAFKSLTTRECKKIMPVEKLFQRSFFDHVIRDDNDYMVRWDYIESNPYRWREDSMYIAHEIHPEKENEEG